jgi:hypothetical protein
MLITEAIITAIGLVIGAILFRIKEIYEIWVRFRESWRKDDDSNERMVISELKDHIRSLKGESDNLKSQIIYLNHEQMECAIEEERLWGALTLVHHHITEQNEVIKAKGGVIGDTPPLPERRIRKRMDPDEFLKRTRELNSRLQSTTGQYDSSNNPNNPQSSTNANTNDPQRNTNVTNTQK